MLKGDGKHILYRRKEAPKPENTENSADWLKRKEKPRNERGQFTSPDKSQTESTRRRGNVECRGHRLNYFRQIVV